jgi:hypothetical protein
MPGVSHRDGDFQVRYGVVDSGSFATAALGILDARAGRYRGYGLRGASILTAELELACSRRHVRLRLRTDAEFQAPADVGEGGGALSFDVGIEPDQRSGLRLTGLGPEPLSLRRGTVDAVRCAMFVFGSGDIEGAGPAAEFGVTVRTDAGVQCAYAYGTPQDPYSPRWELSVRPRAVVERDPGHLLPRSVAIGQIAARCLAG